MHGMHGRQDRHSGCPEQGKGNIDSNCTCKCMCQVKCKGKSGGEVNGEDSVKTNRSLSEIRPGARLFHLFGHFVYGGISGLQQLHLACG